MASFECAHAAELLVGLLYERGVENMRYSGSATAEYGDMTRGKKVIGQASRQAMKELLADIQSGKFAQEWINEYRAGLPRFNQLRAEAQRHPIESVGAKLREFMPWLKSQRLVDRAKN